MERCRRFLATNNKEAAKRAGQAIERQFALLATNSDIGRPYSRRPEWRELLIDFGRSGYVALYKYDPLVDTIYVLAFRHQKEAGY